MGRARLGYFALALVCFGCGQGAAEPDTGTARLGLQSQLWGAAGELFDPKGRLMDWSYAGYRAGEAPLPTKSPNIQVTDHGAIADDTGDDTAAFKAALDAAVAGDVVGVPAGTFIITDTLTLKNGVVLKGSGSGSTQLDMPKSLTDVYGNPGLAGNGQSSYSFGGGFIEADGSDGGTKLADVTANADRGTTTLSLSDTSGISAGDWIQIEQTDVNGALMARLHADLMMGGDDNIGDLGTDFYTRVTSVSGNDVELERALPVDVDTGWSPTIKSVKPRSSEVGVEGLTISFPETSYPGHFMEQGYNAIHFHNLQDSWIRDVRIVNCDYGVNITSSHFVTVDSVSIDTTNQRSGHHALNNGHGGDNLFIGFDIEAQLIHDITNEWYATGVVVTEGRGADLAMDHHRAAPYTTLWTEVDCGAGTRPFKSGGSTNRGPHTAAYDTLWNVTASKDMDFPPDDYGPRMNYIGFRTADSNTSPYDWWVEASAPAEVDPPNLWRAMRQRRLGGGAGGTAGAGQGGGAGVGGSSNPSGGSGGSGATASGGSPSSAAPSTDDGDSGCGCRVSGQDAPRGAWLLLLALVGLRRRRH